MLELRSWVASWRTGERGSVAVIAAGIFGLLGCCGVLGADLGMLYLARREAQAAADLAAISAVKDLTNAEAIVRQVLSDNGITAISDLQVTTGRYSPDPSLAPADRFREGIIPANAVRVDLQRPARLFFGTRILGRETMDVGVHAISAATDMAEFSVGSRLLSLDGGIVNAILTKTLGTNVSLNAVDYRALASTQVNLFQTFDALASSVDLDAVTYQDILDADVTFGDLVNAIGLTDGPLQVPGAISALQALTTAAQASARTLHLADVVDVGPYAAQSAGTLPGNVLANVTVLPTLMAAAAIANGSNQISLDLGATVPGVASARVDLKIGEPEQHSGWLTVGPEGTTLQTSQIRLGVVVTVGGAGLLDAVTLRLPVIVEVANAEARLSDIVCSGMSPTSVTVAARPGVVSAWLGEMSSSDFGNLSRRDVGPADIVEAPLLAVKGKAFAEMAEPEARPLVFNSTDIEDARTRTVGTTHLVGSLTESLLDNLSLEVKVLGLSLGLSDRLVSKAVSDQLAALSRPVDSLLVSLLETLGIGVGEADVTVYGVRCGGPGLVG